MSLHHRLDGEANLPVLVLSSSLGTTLEMWEPQLPALTRRFRVLRYDPRGHGDSAVPPGPYDMADLGEDVLGLLERLGIERASFCGLSLGGMVGMWLAAHAPKRIDRLVLCCTSARLGPPEGWAERAAVVRRSGTAAIADAVLARWFTPVFRAERPETAARFRKLLVSTPSEGYAACCEAIGAWDFRAALGSIRAPTLVIAGADDPATPVKHAELISRGVAGARLAVLPRAAHLASVEQPEAFNRAVVHHLSGAARDNEEEETL